MNEWTKPEHAEAYLARINDIPHRAEGESTLLAEVPKDTECVLDLGCGNGHLLSLVLARCSAARGVGLDFSPTMLEQAERRFIDNQRVTLIEHDMDDPLPDLGTFDCIVSSFAIHHCTHKRKRDLYTEVFSSLTAGGVFCNLEHVSSPSHRIHGRFVQEMGMKPKDEDPSNKLLDVETQLRWLREIGFEDEDCYWKWRELALLVGRKPTNPPTEPVIAADLTQSPLLELYGVDLANIHDVGFSGLSVGWAAGLLQLLRDAGIHDGTVVDLGCGGGGWIEHLVNAGYGAVGVDVSPAMIERSRQRVSSAVFHVGSIWEYSIPSCRAVTALGEVTCYRSQDGEQPSIETLFESVFNALEPGGLFILDIAEVGLDQEKDRTFTEGEDWACLVRYERDEENARFHRHITSFRRVGALYRRSHERHIIQLYEAERVAESLERVGFRVRQVGRFGAASLLPKRVGFIARKANARPV